MSDMDFTMNNHDDEDDNSIEKIFEQKNLPIDNSIEQIFEQNSLSIDKQVDLPKPWKMGQRKGKKGVIKNCYFNPDTGQSFQTKEDLDRYLKFWNAYSRDGKLDLEALKNSKTKRDRPAEGNNKREEKGKRKIVFTENKDDDEIFEEKILYGEGNAITEACEKCYHEECKCLKVPIVYSRRSKKGAQIMTTWIDDKMAIG